MNLSFVAFVVNSALYCTMVFVAGIATENRAAVFMAIATVGICCFSYAAEMVPASKFTLSLCMGLSFLFGAAAGVCLLFGIGK